MSTPNSTRRAQRSLWVLVLVASIATGVLSDSLGAAPGPLVGLRVAVSGVVVVVALTLAVRILVAMERARRHATDPSGSLPRPTRAPRSTTHPAVARATAQGRDRREP